MIINYLEMDNFRQYYGKQKIEFSSKRKQIVTVILGENGRGKTGIYRAIMLAIFGDEKLDQDAKESDINLANIKALEENVNGIKSSVSLKFIHENEEFIIKRTYFSIKEASGLIKEQLLEVVLENKTKNEKWINEFDIKLIMQKMIDERVKHYFFFDGERIERLTRASNKQREEVAVGIKNLLKIDEVLKTKEVLNKLFLKVKKELQENSTGEYKKALKEMSEREAYLNNLKLRGGELVREENESHTFLDELEVELKEYEFLHEILFEREQLDIQARKVSDSKEAKFQQLKILNKYLPLLMGKEVFRKVSTIMSSNLRDESIRGISSELIQQLMSDLRCICGNELTMKEEPYLNLEILYNSVLAFEEKKSLHDLDESLKRLSSYLEGRQESLAYIMHELKQLINEEEQIRGKIEELNVRVNNNEKLEIKELNFKRNATIKNLVRIEHEKKINSEEIVDFDKKIQNFSLALKELERRSGIHSQLLVKHEVLEKSVLKMDNLINIFEKEMIKELEISTQNNFHQLLDESGKTMLKKVQIKEDYTIEVLNKFNKEFLANISQGQRQVLSLSFITALAQVSGGKEILEMPLLMDTPFGRLSGTHQQKLIEYLPQVCSQWVLLVTDKEYGAAEEELFSKKQVIGKYYRLNSVEPGVTLIEEIV